MYTFPIVDAHVHLYDVRLRRHPRLEHVPQLKVPFLMSDYAAAVGAATVQQFVFIEVAACHASKMRSLRELRGFFLR